MAVNRYRYLQAVLALVFVMSAGILAYQIVYLPMKNREAVEQLKEDFPEGIFLRAVPPPMETPHRLEKKKEFRL